MFYELQSAKTGGDYRKWRTTRVSHWSPRLSGNDSIGQLPLPVEIEKNNVWIPTPLCVDCLLFYAAWEIVLADAP